MTSFTTTTFPFTTTTFPFTTTPYCSEVILIIRNIIKCGSEPD
jgi:hypothetical protein